jgi:response regulator NasT
MALAKQVMAETPLPLVVLSSCTDDAAVEDAAKTGVYAYLVKPASPESLVPTIKMAVARFNEIKEIRRESEENRQALETRKLVERAKYTLMARLNLGEEAAFAHIRDKCRNQNKTMKETAIEILDADTAFLRSIDKAPLNKARSY